ncbi:hypothetical protein K402DRAFT_11370 [Aulographum hederae CBS 113979]|uniref:Uncharacterized protein n=1 Tax=Aulographum hederae CBS 113979 TaxID=1176131 RepID=A0A6G1HHD4_9PEZI|nr:hypothetical protein K402DRAFT_11370 [Aulographum hederae CBS 113979]
MGEFSQDMICFFQKRIGRILRRILFPTRVLAIHFPLMHLCPFFLLPSAALLSTRE